MEGNLSWMEEKISHLPKNNGLYRFACFFLHRKLSYKELYLILVTINESLIGREESEKRALNEILKVYKYLNGKLPNGI